MTDPLNYFAAPGAMKDLEDLIEKTVKDLVKITNLTQEQAIKLANEKFYYLSKNYEAAINKQVLLDACLNKLNTDCKDALKFDNGKLKKEYSCEP